MRSKRRHILLLEVMIAIAIILLCILPLIYPHASLARTQREFLHKVELDHIVSLMFADIYNDLLNNKIEWMDIQNHKKFEIDEQLLEKYSKGHKLPFKGYYHFEQLDIKPHSSQPQENYAYIYRLQFVFTPLYSKNAKEAKYNYNIFILRDLRTNKETGNQENNDENKT